MASRVFIDINNHHRDKANYGEKKKQIQKGKEQKKRKNLYSMYVNSSGVFTEAADGRGFSK